MLKEKLSHIKHVKSFLSIYPFKSGNTEPEVIRGTPATWAKEKIYKREWKESLWFAVA